MILTNDREVKKLLELAESVADSRATVLVTGESGTGKELFARFLHAKSSRSKQKLIAVNCAAMPEGLLESELFGHEKGSFTGAIQTKIGKFEAAHESTLLLDEMGEMPLALQAKLLRAIQEKEIERVGGNRTIPVNVRIIATTNKDLKRMVQQGLFREDLYYRLNVIHLHIPPLRSRPADIELLAHFFVESSCLTNRKSMMRISELALKKLQEYSWPGNVRELENVLERTVLTNQTVFLEPEHFYIEASHTALETLRPGMTVEQAEKLLIMKTLEHTKQNRTEAARLLGISIRTLRNKLHVYREGGGLHDESV